MIDRYVCNYCRLQKLKHEAELNGMKITIQPDLDDTGYDVFVHPADVEIPEHVRRGPDEENHPEFVYWKSWLFRDWQERGCFC